MEPNSQFPTGEWGGFYLEDHQPRRGWMHLYLAFADGKITGEGTDYVGPWNAIGIYDPKTGTCQWTKQYVGKHAVQYQGVCDDNGIQGVWQIGIADGKFHIWPKSMNHLTEMYMQDELTEPFGSSTLQLGTVPDDDFLPIV